MENRSPYDPVMARQSFQKNSSSKTVRNSNLEPNELGGKIPAQAPGRLGCRLGSRHAQGQVDCPVDTGVDLGGPTTLARVHLLGIVLCSDGL